MNVNELFDALQDDPVDLLPFSLCVVRRCPESDELEASPILDVEFDHDDQELNLLANTTPEGEPYSGEPLTLGALTSRLGAERSAVAAYSLFVSSPWASMQRGYEGRLCLPVRGVVLNREVTVVGLLVDSSDFQGPA